MMSSLGRGSENVHFLITLGAKNDQTGGRGLEMVSFDDIIFGQSLEGKYEIKMRNNDFKIFIRCGVLRNWIVKHFHP